MSKLFNRVEFWIVLFFLIRLLGITSPPLEIYHNWRQITGLMVARNFLEIDPNIFYPRVDETYGNTGIVGMEFPVLNYIHFLISKVFGYSHYYGRLINLIVSSIGLFFYFKIIKKYFNHQVALISTLCLIGSIWFAFSRKMMPDTFCISLMFIGLYFSLEYLDKGRFLNIFLAMVFTSLAILSKIPAGIYFAVFILFAFNKNNVNRKSILGLVTVIPLTLTYIWYFVWNPLLSQKFGTWYNSGKGFSTGFYEIISNLDLTLERFYYSSFHSYIFTSFFVIGLYQMFRKSNNRLILLFGTMFFIFLIYMFKSGFFFYHHSYYIIPFVPVMALVTGYSISLIKKQWLFTVIISLGIIESVANQQHDFFNKESEKYKLSLEAIADSVSAKQDLIVINGNENPQQLYLTHRKGWTCNDDQISDSLFIQEIALKGCKFIFANKHSYSDKINFKMVFDNKDYSVYEIGGIRH